MHKKFYASGFLFHLPSQQILLQQPTPASSAIASPWLLFNTPYEESDDPNEVFKSVISDLLQVKITTIYPVYAYVNDTTHAYQTIMYAKLKKFEDFPPKNGLTFGWFSFKEVLKIKADEQTKHDIVVGQRVIEAARRRETGEHTF